jgi:nucleoside-diphosphate-sugar epimerase
VRDVARAVRLCVEHSDGSGGIFNVGESTTAPVRLWAEQILAAAGTSAELVAVPDDVLPEDLSLTASSAIQHVLTDSRRFRDAFGWTSSDPDEAISASVRWHLRNPPTDNVDFAADDRALGAG